MKFVFMVFGGMFFLASTLEIVMRAVLKKRGEPTEKIMGKVI